MIIRKIEKSDIENYFELRKNLNQKTKFIVMDLPENFTLEDVKEYIENIESNPNSNLFVAEDEENDKQLVGSLVAIGSQRSIKRHCVNIGLGILLEYTGKGIGSNLFEKMEKWAIDNKIYRLELNVVDYNEVEVNLYKKMGFEIEGTKKHSLLIDNEYVNEYCMAKLLK